MLIPVILAGGNGTRLWPLSRASYPKPLIPGLFTEDTSLFQETLQRLKQLPTTLDPIIVCNAQHRFIVAEQLQQQQAQAHLLLETEPRDTAAAIALATCYAQQHYATEDPHLLILPSDHHMGDPKGLSTAIEHALLVAQSPNLLLFGITPTHPNTGYGYLQSGPQYENSTQVHHVTRFVEKPDIIHAQQYLDAGDYYWNSGILLSQTSTLTDAFHVHQPDLWSCCQTAIVEGTEEKDFFCPNLDALSNAPTHSIDHAVLEHYPHNVMMHLSADWSDLGDWDALWYQRTKDADGNALQGDVTTFETHNSYVHATDRLVVTLGIDDHIIVDTPDAILIAQREHSQKIKHVAQCLMQQSRKEAISHKRTYRPWGWYDSVETAPRFQVKHLHISPHCRLSLQKHHHRSEHWTVVEGSAQVTRGKETLFITENESTFIPCGMEHRIENPGKMPLIVIEVQAGSYLGEDDIVRIEDDYQRDIEDAV